MTQSLVLTQNNAPLSSNSVQKGRGKSNASEPKDQQLFQHLLDVLSSSASKLNSDLNPETAHANQSPVFNNFRGSLRTAQDLQKKAVSSTKLLTVQVKTVSQTKKSPLKLHTGSFIYVGDLKRAPLRVGGKHMNNSAPVSAGKVSAGEAKHRGADGKNGAHGKKQGVLAQGYIGPPLLGILMMPQTMPKSGPTEAAAKVQSQAGNGSVNSIALQLQASPRQSKGPVGTNGLVAMPGKSGQNPALNGIQGDPLHGGGASARARHGGSAHGNAAETKVSARVIQQDGQFTLAGFPVEKVRLTQSQGVKTSSSFAGTAQDIAHAQGGQIGTGVTGSNLIQSPASVLYGKIASASALSNGKDNGNSSASNQAAATVMPGQQQVAPAPVMNAAAGSAVVNIQDPQVYQQFAAMIHQQVQAGSQTLQIQVHPQGLGSITVAIGQQNQGLAIQVSATNPATAAWLQQESSQLTQALQSAGVHLANLQVNVSQQQGRDQSDSRSGQKKGSKTHELGRIRGISKETAQRTQPVVPVLDSRQSTISLRA